MNDMRPVPAAMLDGKAIVITGAGRGVGRAHALTLASLGATVVVNDLGTSMDGSGADQSCADEVVAEINEAGGTAVANHDDVSTWAGAERIIATSIQAFGRLDGLVNNAGNLRRGKLVNVTEEDVDSILSVHVKGTFGCTVHALKHWKQRFEATGERGGSVVSTHSEAFLVSLPNFALYNSAKAAIAQMTTTGSREANSFGARLNAYGPRATTRMSHFEKPNHGSAVAAYTDVEAADDPKNPKNSSPLVAWLLSDQSVHVSGQVFISVGGGVGVCSPWATGRIVWPPDGRARFGANEIGAVIDAQLFGSRYPALAMAEPPDMAANARRE